MARCTGIAPVCAFADLALDGARGAYGAIDQFGTPDVRCEIDRHQAGPPAQIPFARPKRDLNELVELVAVLSWPGLGEPLAQLEQVDELSSPRTLDEILDLVERFVDVVQCVLLAVSPDDQELLESDLGQAVPVHCPLEAGCEFLESVEHDAAAVAGQERATVDRGDGPDLLVDEVQFDRSVPRLLEHGDGVLHAAGPGECKPEALVDLEKQRARMLVVDRGRNRLGRLVVDDGLRGCSLSVRDVGGLDQRLDRGGRIDRRSSADHMAGSTCDGRVRRCGEELSVQPLEHESVQIACHDVGDDRVLDVPPRLITRFADLGHQANLDEPSQACLDLGRLEAGDGDEYIERRRLVGDRQDVEQTALGRLGPVDPVLDQIGGRAWQRRVGVGQCPAVVQSNEHVPTLQILDHLVHEKRRADRTCPDEIDEPVGRMTVEPLGQKFDGLGPIQIAHTHRRAERAATQWRQEASDLLSFVGVGRAHGGQDPHCDEGEVAAHELEQLQARDIGPVQVVDEPQHGSFCGDASQQRGHGVVQPGS